jgi:hypothetical protein
VWRLCGTLEPGLYGQITLPLCWVRTVVPTGRPSAEWFDRPSPRQLASWASPGANHAVHVHTRRPARLRVHYIPWQPMGQARDATGFHPASRCSVSADCIRSRRSAPVWPDADVDHGSTTPVAPSSHARVNRAVCLLEHQRLESDHTTAPKHCRRAVNFRHDFPRCTYAAGG